MPVPRAREDLTAAVASRRLAKIRAPPDGPQYGIMRRYQSEGRP